MKGIVLTWATGGLGSALGNLLVDDRDSDLICVYRDKIKFEKLYKKKLNV